MDLAVSLIGWQGKGISWVQGQGHDLVVETSIRLAALNLRIPKKVSLTSQLLCGDCYGNLNPLMA